MSREKLNYEVDRLTFQVPKEIKDDLYKKIKPLVKKEVNKFKKNRDEETTTNARRTI